MTEWTTSPPTKPGWYWYRSEDEDGQFGPFCACVWQSITGLMAQILEDRGDLIEMYDGEWWPEPIQEPPND